MACEQHGRVELSNQIQQNMVPELMVSTVSGTFGCRISARTVSDGDSAAADPQINKMDQTNRTVEDLSPVEHTLALLLSDYTIALVVICLVGLIFGSPLAANMLWNLRVATEASGRGVMRLILLQQRLNLLSAMSICMELLILAFPSGLPSIFCISFESTVWFILVNRQLSSICIGLGR